MKKTIRAILIGKSYRLIRLGIGLSICFLIFDIMFDVFYFGEGDLLEVIFAPSLYEIYMRFSVITLVLTFSAYVQVITRRLETNQSELERELVARKQAEIERSQLLDQRTRLANELSSILDSTSEGIYGLDRQGHCTFANKAATEMLGYAAADLIGQHMHTLIHHSRPDGSPYPVEDCPIYRAFESGKNCRTDNEVLWRRDGTSFPAEYSSNPVLEGESVGGAVVTFADITERKQGEERIQQQLERLTALNLIDQAINASSELRITLDILLQQVATQLQVDAAAVLLHNSQLHTLKFEVGRGFRSNAYSRTQVRLGEGQAGKAALQRQIVAHPNFAVNPPNFAMPEVMAGESFAAYYAVPLIAKGQVKGVLEVFHRTRLNPDKDWLNFLETLAGQAAIAIDNAELFNNLYRSSAELMQAYDATIEGWSRALDLRDKETEGHTRRVTEITLRLAEVMGYKDEELVHIRRGALLHDMGKLGVPDNILLKPEPLTDDDWVIMKRHPQFAYDLLAPINYLHRALDIPYCHHEKWDGTGYPRGLKGEQIPLAARIFAVVDVWDALRSDRPYRAGWSKEKVRDHIHQQSGIHFDPKVVEVFLKLGV